jgi:hypothetical protein
MAIRKRRTEIGQRRNVRFAAPQFAHDLADHPGIVPLPDPVGDARQVIMAAEDFPQISAKRLFHQINLNSARRVCSALFCSVSVPLSSGAFR